MRVQNQLQSLFLYLGGALLILISSCLPYQEEKLTDIKLDIKNKKIQQLYDLQDQQQTDSLFAYFKHKDPTYRYLAAMAFGSIKDKNALDSLIVLLKDDIPEVRAAAAYAIGQIGEPTAADDLIRAFNQQDTQKLEANANQAILEAVGKCAPLDFLKHLSTISTYQATDTLLLLGQAYGIYRYALRNMVAQEGTARMIDLATQNQYPSEVRLIAAHYLQRAKNILIDSLAASSIIETIKSENDVAIRMALVLGLGKAKTEQALQTLLECYEKESDYRIKCNIIRALGNFDYGKVQATILKALKAPNEHLANTAAQFFLDHGIQQDATFYWRTAKDTLPWQARLTMYLAANTHLPSYYGDFKGAINYELRNLFYASDNPYEKAAVLKAMAPYGWNYRYIHQLGYTIDMPIVRTASVETLKSIAEMPNFRQAFGLGYVRATRELTAHFLEAIQTGDPAMTTIAAQALRTPQREFKTFIDSLSVLETALDRLEMPQDLQTHNELQHTLAYLKGETPPSPVAPSFNHPIDWSIIESLGQSPKAKIRTRWGTITLELLTKQAPATVANFVHLARSGFYEGKTFHRIVPNFVIQSGSPRGDGWGGTNFSIRSELPQIYYKQEGYVGMASSGNHTESSQFFITHSPTPHLDGNYTIFAKVTEGMEVVHKIKLGDIIERIGIID